MAIKFKGSYVIIDISNFPVQPILEKCLNDVTLEELPIDNLDLRLIEKINSALYKYIRLISPVPESIVYSKLLIDSKLTILVNCREKQFTFDYLNFQLHNFSKG